MSGKLTNKVSIITGGNSGIGASTAHLFAKEGSKVLILARREVEGLKVQESIRAEGGECTFVKCDVGEPNSVNQAIEEASSIYGAVHILFNNAGHGGGGEFPN